MLLYIAKKKNYADVIKLEGPEKEIILNYPGGLKEITKASIRGR